MSTAIRSYASLSYDTSGFQCLHEGEDGKKVHGIPGRFNVGHAFVEATVFDPDLASLTELGDYVLRMERHGQPEARLVSCERCEAAGTPAIAVILKWPFNDTTKMLYHGKVFIPFMEFTYWIYVNAIEQGPVTGLRDSMLLTAAINSGRVKHGPDGIEWNGFSTDDESHDASFPDHPVTVVREVMRLVRQSARLTPEVAACPRLPLPNE